MEHDELQGHYQFPDSETFKLSISPSLLPKAGLGLFATQAFSKGEFVAEYYGSVVTAHHSQSHIFDDEDKMVQMNEKYCMISRGPASRANDIINFKPTDYLTNYFQQWMINRQFPTIKGFLHNAKLSMESREKVFIKATRDINPGEEIFIDYGFEYWLYYYKQYYPNHSHTPTSD